MLAYRLQADELGDLAPDAIRLLKQLANSGTTIGITQLTAAFDRRRTEYVTLHTLMIHRRQRA